MAGDSDVEVRFGAQIEGLLAGVNAVKESIASVTGPVNEVMKSLGEMKEVLIAAFAVDQAAEFVDRITAIGEQILRGTEMTGLSAREFQTLSYAMKATGGEAGNLGIVVDRLERNIALARGGSGQAVQAFQTLGVSMDDLKNKTPYQIIEQIADGFHNLRDPILAAGAATEVGSRGFAQMLPSLKAGSEGLEEFGQRFRETGAYMNDVQAGAMAQTHERLIELETSVQGTGVQMIRVFKPAIDLLVVALTDLVQWLNKVLSAMADLVQILEGSILLGFAKCIEMVEEFGVEANLVVEKLKAAWQALGRIITDVAHGSIGQAANEWKAAQEQMDAATKKAQVSLESYGRQYEELRLKIAQSTGALTNFYGALGEKKGAGGGGGALNPGAGNNDAEQIALDQIKTEEELAKIGLASQKDLLEQEVADKRISKAQEFEILQQYLQLEYQAQAAALDKQLALYENDEVKYQQTLNKRAVLDAQYQQQLARLAAQSAQAQAQDAKKINESYKQVFDLVGNDFTQMMNGVLQGTETWGEAVGRMFANIAESAIAAIAKIIAEWLLFEAVTLGQGTWNDFMALAEPGGSGLLHTGTRLIKSYDVGSWNIPSDQLAYVHAGEMIVPASQAGAIRSGSAGLGGTGAQTAVTININAIDTQTGAQFLKNNAHIIAQAVSGQARNFNSNLRM